MESIRNKFPEKNIRKLMDDLSVFLREYVNNASSERNEEMRDKRIRGMTDMISELCYLMLKYDIRTDNVVSKEIYEKVRKRFPEKSTYELVKETLGLACECVSKVSGDSLLNIYDLVTNNSRERKVSEFMKELCELMHKHLVSDMVPNTFVLDNWIYFKKELSNDIHKYIIFSTVFNIEETEAESMSRDIPYVNPLDYSNFKKWWENNVGQNDTEMDKKYMDIAVKTLFSFCPILICMNELGKVSYHLIVSRATEACRELHERIHDSERYWDINIPE